MEVEHLGISKTEELHKLKGTKYVQSKIGTNYKDVKRELLKGKKSSVFWDSVSSGWIGSVFR